MLENIGLFLHSLLASSFAWVGGILRVIPLFENLIEPSLRKHARIKEFLDTYGAGLKRNLKGIALLCLFIGCYRAWVFEHNNAQNAMYGVEGKAVAWSKYNSCDKALAVKTALADTYSQSLTYQESRNDGQQDLFNRCLLSLTETTQIKQKTTLLDRRFSTDDLKSKGKFATILTLLTNKPSTPASFHITCNASVNSFAIMPADGSGLHLPAVTKLDSTSGIVTLNSPPWSPSQPIFVEVIHDEPLIRCTLTPRRQ